VLALRGNLTTSPLLFILRRHILVPPRGVPDSLRVWGADFGLPRRETREEHVYVPFSRGRARRARRRIRTGEAGTTPLSNGGTSLVRYHHRPGPAAAGNLVIGYDVGKGQILARAADYLSLRLGSAPGAPRRVFFGAAFFFFVFRLPRLAAPPVSFSSSLSYAFFSDSFSSTSSPFLPRGLPLPARRLDIRHRRCIAFLDDRLLLLRLVVGASYRAP